MISQTPPPHPGGSTAYVKVMGVSQPTDTRHGIGIGREKTQILGGILKVTFWVFSEL